MLKSSILTSQLFISFLELTLILKVKFWTECYCMAARKFCCEIRIYFEKFSFVLFFKIFSPLSINHKMLGFDFKMAFEVDFQGF